MEGDITNSDTKHFIRNILLELVDDFGLHHHTFKKDDSMDNMPSQIESELKFEQFYTRFRIGDKYTLNYIKTKQQHGGGLCGFHSLFNAIHFLKYIKTRGKKDEQMYYMKKMNSPVHFWLFYKKNLDYLLNCGKVGDSDKKSLRDKGPLERYQFSLLLQDKPDIKEKVASDEENEIHFYSFFYAFNFIQNCKDETSVLQEALEKFRSYTGKKNLIYFVLLGVTNHWSLLVLENKEGVKTFNYLDSTNNLDVFNLKTSNEISEHLIKLLSNNQDSSVINACSEMEIYAEKHLEEISKYRKVASGWLKTCFIQWLSDINITLKLFFKIVYENYSLYDYMMESRLIRLVTKFEQYNQHGLSNEGEENQANNVIIKEQLLSWLKLEYHPKILEVDFLNAIRKYKNIERIRQMRIYENLKHMIIYCKQIESSIHIVNWAKEQYESDDLREDAQLIHRFYNVLDQIAQVLEIIC